MHLLLRGSFLLLVCPTTGWLFTHNETLDGHPLAPYFRRRSYQKFCDAKWRCTYIRPETILDHFPRLLLTIGEIKKVSRKMGTQGGGGDSPAIPGRDRPLKESRGRAAEYGYPQTDGDACCPTYKFFGFNRTLTNVNGAVKSIIHLTSGNGPNRYQLIPYGTCISGNFGCKGTCITENRTFSLLVLDLDSNLFPPVAFDQFYISSYCSCKNS